ncbi:MAG: FHA domain-containing protein [Isosphaeraceae bacterium]|nr:FHA domain-containing protein [Isosphaeraceae bacterium]
MNRTGVDPFLAACGGEGPLIVKSGVRDAGTEPRSLRQPFLVVGRLPRGDVCLDNPQVSRRHAYFQLLDGRLYGVDLGSRTGTVHAGKPLEAGWIDPAQDVRIGPFGLRLLSGSRGSREGEDATEPSDPLNPDFGQARFELPPARLEVAIAGAPPRVWRMGGALALIGHGSLCRLRLKDHRVARYHCSLVRVPEGLWVVDLLTEWGTAHNGSLIRSCPVLPGDFLSIGPFSIRLLESEARVPARRREGASLAAATTSANTPERAQSPIDSAPAEWFPTGTFCGSVSATAALNWEPVNRLEALERRQDAMQDQFQQAIMLMLKAFGGMHREQMDVLTSELAEVRRLSGVIDELRAEMLQRPVEAPSPRVTDGPVVAPSDRDHPPREPEAAPWSDLDACDPESLRVRRDPREVHAFVSERLAAFERERQGRWSRILHTLTRTS